MKKNEEAKLPRIYATRALVKEVEKGVFEMYRDVMIENEKGEPEKFGKPIHISFLREATKDEEPDATTSRPDGSVILLKRVAKQTEL